MFLIDILGQIMKLCYDLVSSYVIMMVIFTFITKLILSPISIWLHKNSIKFTKMLPEINDMKISYYGDRDVINEKKFEIYKKYKYNPFLDMIPLVLQLLILFGVINVVNAPDRYGFAASDMIDFGFDFSVITVDTFGVYIIIPLLAGLSAFLMCFLQNKHHVMQSEQSKANQYFTMILSVGISLYFGFFVRSGVVLYWICSNLLSILQMYILNACLSPKKHIDYDRLNKTKDALSKIDSSDKGLTREQKSRQRKDYKRFFSVANKHIVFYSEGSGYYKYFKRLIQWLLKNSNIIIHYVTSDPDDKIFEMNNDRIRSYFIGSRKLITLFMKLDSDICIMSTPDLDNYQYKRSYVKKDIEYIFIDHAIGDVNASFRNRALDNFDTIFCTSKFMYDEIKAREKLHGLKEKTLIKSGYDVLDDMIEEYAKYEKPVLDRKLVLIAPSHQKDNIIESCLDDVIDVFKRRGYAIVLRPHPQFIRRKSEYWLSIIEKYATDDDVITESDFSKNLSIYDADILVTDWSCIAEEYSFVTKRPSLYIDTPMKVVNPEYKELNITPLTVVVRDKIGEHISPDDIGDSGDIIDRLLTKDYADQINAFGDEILYNIGTCVDVEGNYILDSLINKER